MLLIANNEYAKFLTCLDSVTMYSGDEAALHWSEIEEKLSAGESMVFASPEHLSLLNSLWITLVPGTVGGQTATKNCPANISNLSIVNAKGYVGICPPSHYALHGVHEEPRMEHYPFLVEKDQYGTERGTLGLLLKHYDKSLTFSRFQGGCWYVLSAELTGESLDALCQAAIQYSKSQCMITRLRPEFPLYYSNERVRLRCQIRNSGKELQAAELSLKAVWENCSIEIGTRELMLNASDTTDVELDWYPGSLPEEGLCTIQATLKWMDRKSYGHKRDASAVLIDQMEEKVYFRKEENRKRPAAGVTPTAISIDGETDFWIGTHYYPCTDFYELSYRPMRTALAEQEIKRMAASGVRICRIWCDPILEEASIRGMEVLLEMFADHGIVAIVTFFTSWARWLEVCIAECQCRFEAVDMIDDSYIGLIPQNMECQKSYVAVLGQRWKHISNLIWDLTNEFSVVKDSPEQAIMEFEAWACSLKDALRLTGAEQPLIFGTSCWDTGSENYRCNTLSDIVPDHNYQVKGAVEYLPFYQNSACRKQPFFTEEFGGVWTDHDERAREYCYRYHMFLASGNAAAVNYEWGVIWLADGLSGMPAYLKYQNEAPVDELEGFFYTGRDSYSKTWPAGTAGLCPWIASPEYGCIVTAANVLTPTNLVMKRLAQIGKGLQYVPKPENVYLLLPFETKPFAQGVGYQRFTERINRWLNMLWARGTDFEIWQEDRIAELPASAKILLCPNEQNLTPQMEEAFCTLKARGVEIFRDGDERWADRLPIVSLEPSDHRRLLHRSVPNGSLQVLINDGEQRCFTYGKLKIEVAQSGLWLEQQDKLTLAGFKGTLSYGSLSTQSEGMAYVRSCDGTDLESAACLEVLPLECGRIDLPEDTVSAELWDDTRMIAALEVKRQLQITQEYLPYSLHLRRMI